MMHEFKRGSGGILGCFGVDVVFYSLREFFFLRRVEGGLGCVLGLEAR